MKRTSLKTAISELQAKVLGIVNNPNHTEKMKELLVSRELNNFSLNIRRGNYSMDIDDSDISIVSEICTSTKDPVFEETLMPLLIGADERQKYLS